MMFRPFEHAGYWWDPRDPGTRWPGTLNFDPVNGAVLSRTIPFDVSQLLAKRAEFPLIHGVAASGLEITLINCFERGGTGIFANEVIAGFHADDPDPLVITAAAVVENMSEWWGPAAMAHQPTPRHSDVGVRYEQPEPVEVHADESARTTIRSGARSSFERRRVSIEEEIRIEMAAFSPQRLSFFRRRIHACQDLISIGALTLCNLDDFRICPPSPENRRRLAHVYGVPIFKNPAEGWPDFLVHSRDIEARLEDTFTAWFGCAESLSVVRSLYMSGAYGKGFIELRLLALAQAAEAYHRRAYEGRDLYMDAVSYERDILPGLKAAIPPALDLSHRDALRSRLR